MSERPYERTDSDFRPPHDDWCVLYCDDASCAATLCWTRQDARTYGDDWWHAPANVIVWAQSQVEHAPGCYFRGRR